MRHIHADFIIAWAEGKEIQCMDCGFWYDVSKTNIPTFNPNIKYRIKPEPIADIVKEFRFILDELDQCVSSLTKNPNVRFLFDGETKQLKSVEKL